MFGAHRNQLEQHLVALSGELVDRLAVSLFEDALDDPFLELRREFCLRRQEQAASARRGRLREEWDGPYPTDHRMWVPAFHELWSRAEVGYRLGAGGAAAAR